ncbi:MAG TPA: hypothetical protein VN706_19265 [Gemmatimonadaceae bacterium]|nr:hypothetical protein [Gemmatimonadaceae bacterium]
MIWRAAALALGLWGGAIGAQTIRVADAGRGPGPELLARELAKPHIVMPPASDRAVLARDHVYASSVIIFGRDAVVEGQVRGDVVVIGGDLYMHPGAAVTGRLIAFGGGVYLSALATQSGDVAFREFTYDIAPEPGGYALSYRAAYEPVIPAVAAAGLFGLALPSYDRSNGLSLPVGLDFSPGAHAVFLRPRLTYRSQLGRVDPSITVDDSLNRYTAVRLWAGQATFSNEGWIWSAPVNTTEFLLLGHDARNYFRATRADLTIGHRVEAGTTTLEFYAGGRYESARAVRPLDGAGSAPWTFHGHHDTDDALRPNPEIAPVSGGSALAGLALAWTPGDIVARFRADEEIGHFGDECNGCGLERTGTFAQTTLDGAIEFPTFGTQSLRFEGHGVVSTHHTPEQRFAYVGGKGTLSTLEMLELGGNELVYVDARYNVPIDRVQLPMVGAPVVTVREVLAGATVDEWPRLHQGVGLRLSLSALYGEFLVDPDTRLGHFSVGLSIRR